MAFVEIVNIVQFWKNLEEKSHIPSVFNAGGWKELFKKVIASRKTVSLFNWSWKRLNMEKLCKMAGELFMNITSVMKQVYVLTKAGRHPFLVTEFMWFIGKLNQNYLHSSRLTQGV